MITQQQAQHSDCAGAYRLRTNLREMLFPGPRIAAQLPKGVLEDLDEDAACTDMCGRWHVGEMLPVAAIELLYTPEQELSAMTSSNGRQSKKARWIRQRRNSR